MYHRALYEIIERDGIVLEYAALAVTEDNILGIYYRDTQLARPVIVIDHSLRGIVAHHDTVLAEELGHHMTSPRNGTTVIATCRASRMICAQDEMKAIRWACDMLIPDAELFLAVQRGYQAAHEIAEYFLVTEWLVYRKFGFLKERGRSLGVRMLAALSMGNAAGM